MTVEYFVILKEGIQMAARGKIIFFSSGNIFERFRESRDVILSALDNFFQAITNFSMFIFNI